MVVGHNVRESPVAAVGTEEGEEVGGVTEQHILRVAGLQHPQQLALISSRGYLESFISLCSYESGESG